MKNNKFKQMLLEPQIIAIQQT